MNVVRTTRKPSTARSRPARSGPARGGRLARLAAVAVMAVALPAAVAAAPATSASVKGSLVVLSVTDSGSGLAGVVAGRPFDVAVQALDTSGVPLAVSTDTRVRLSLASGGGTLSGVLDAVIAKKTSTTTISGAIYSAVANGVSFTVTQLTGTSLSPGTVSGIVSARSATRAEATPNQALSVTDPGCAAPTADSPVCGYLVLPNGGNGTVLMSVGSCDSILSCRTVGGATAELVTAAVDLKDGAGSPLYTRAAPATFILACDKALCGNTGVGQVPVTVDLTNTGAFTSVPDCPAKGELGATQDVCLDTVQSKRDNAGDLYSYILFVHDIRGSYP